jgi:hypothetical protein
VQAEAAASCGQQLDLIPAARAGCILLPGTHEQLMCEPRCHLPAAAPPPNARLDARMGARGAAVEEGMGARGAAVEEGAMPSASTRKFGVEGAAATASVKPRACDAWAMPDLSCEGRMPQRLAAASLLAA